ncbi:MAG: hypothetical protein LBD75_03210 [Candidatus Peribacteria bacterium]|jgi:hypothetical protein|nr:hypothetical protein [Candidatus Peribacteria bacterium]
MWKNDLLNGLIPLGEKPFIHKDDERDNDTVAIEDVFSEEQIDNIIDMLRDTKYDEAYAYFVEQFRTYEKNFLE